MEVIALDLAARVRARAGRCRRMAAAVSNGAIANLLLELAADISRIADGLMETADAGPRVRH